MRGASRAVSVLQVADPGVWPELEVLVGGLLGEALSPTRRVVLPGFEPEGLALLTRRGVPVLVRHARRPLHGPPEQVAEIATLAGRLSRAARDVLTAAQRHAQDGVVYANHAWDPGSAQGSVRELLGAGLMEAIPDLDGRYRLHPDLPPPPLPAYHFEEATLPDPDDLGPIRPGPVALLHDLAALAAAIEVEQPHRTLAGGLGRADQKKLARRLGVSEALDLEGDARWGRAWRALVALGVVGTDPVNRAVYLDLGLDDALAGAVEDAVDRLVRRLIEADLHAALPAVRAALALGGALDTVIWLELLREQDRGVLFNPWRRGAAQIYPMAEGDTPQLYDDNGWELLETRLLHRLLGRLERLGLVRLAPGVFAPTPDGRRWAGAAGPPPPPLWVGSDLDVLVPPESLTPYERFQLERLSRCQQRDIADRYRLERAGLQRWLATHSLEEALELLRRRAPGLPPGVTQTLNAWSDSVTRVILERGVLLPNE